MSNADKFFASVGLITLSALALFALYIGLAVTLRFIIRVKDYRLAVAADAEAKAATERANRLAVRVIDLEQEVEELRRGITPYRGKSPSVEQVTE